MFLEYEKTCRKTTTTKIPAFPISLHPISASPGLIKIITYNNSCGEEVYFNPILPHTRLFLHCDTKTHNSLGNPDAKMIVLV